MMDIGDNALSFSPDGTLIAIAGGKEVWLWDVASKQQVATLQLGDEDETTALSLSFSPDGTLLAIAGFGQGEDGTAWLWDVASRKQVATLQHDGYWTRSLSFSPDGTLLAIAGNRAISDGWEGKLWLWDVSKWKRSQARLTTDSDGEIADDESSGEDQPETEEQPTSAVELRRHIHKP